MWEKRLRILQAHVSQLYSWYWYSMCLKAWSTLNEARAARWLSDGKLKTNSNHFRLFGNVYERSTLKLMLYVRYILSGGKHSHSSKYNNFTHSDLYEEYCINSIFIQLAENRFAGQKKIGKRTTRVGELQKKGPSLLRVLQTEWISMPQGVLY